MNKLYKILFLSIFSSFYANTLFANQALIEKVVAECTHKRVCKFDVTIRHADEGWEHFANGWKIYSSAGEVLGYRALAHPHVNEQPRLYLEQMTLFMAKVIENM